MKEELNAQKKLRKQEVEVKKQELALQTEKWQAEQRKLKRGVNRPAQL